MNKKNINEPLDWKKLKTYEGFENTNDQEAKEIINNIELICEIIIKHEIWKHEQPR